LQDSGRGALLEHDGLGVQGVAVEDGLGKDHVGEAEIGDDGALRQLGNRQSHQRRQRKDWADTVVDRAGRSAPATPRPDGRRGA